VAMKKCWRCKTEKDTTEYHKNRNKPDGLADGCKACVKITNKEYILKNKNRVYAKMVGYRAAHKDKTKAYNAEWHKNNPDRSREIAKAYRDRHPERKAARASLYGKLNRHKVNATTNRYRANKLNATPPWANGAEIEKYYKEAARLTQETGIQHHVDHILPLRGQLVSGFHCENNLQVLPGRINQSKGNRMVIA